MKLLPGMEHPDHVAILLDLTDIRAPDMTQAVIDHLVRGMPISAAAAANGVQQPNLSTNMQSVRRVNELIERAKEIAWPDYQRLKRERNE